MEIKVFGLPILSTKSSVNWTMDQAFRWLFNKGDSGKITQANAFAKHVWVYSAINSIAQNIARAKFKIYKRPTQKDSQLQEVFNTPVNKLFEKPSNYFNKFQLFEGIEVYKNIAGEAFILMERVGNMIVNFDFIPPSNMKSVANNGVLVAWEMTTPKGGKVILDIEDIIHIKYFNPYNRIRGLSPLSAAMLSIETDDDARKWNRNVINSGSSVGGVLSYDKELSEEQFERIKLQWNRNNAGQQNAGKVAVLEGGAKYEEMRLTQTDVSYIEQRVQSKEEIGSIFKVPPNELNDYENANYNSQTQSLNFWNKKLFPEMESIEASFDEDFFQLYYPEYIGRFDRKSIPEIQVELASKIDQAKKMWDMGVPLNQINTKLELDFDLTGLKSAETAFLPMNLINAEELAAATIPDTEPEAAPAAEEDEDDKAFKDVVEAINKLDAETKRKFLIWKRFINQVNPLIRKFKPALREYIFELRQEILKTFYDQADAILDKGSKIIKSHTMSKFLTKKDLEISLNKAIKEMIKADPLFDKAAQKRKAVQMATPFYEDAVLKGGSIAFAEIGVDIEFGITGSRTVDFFNKTRESIQKIVDTIDSQVQDVIEAGIKEGLPVSEVSANLKNKLKNAANRSNTIARTEMSKAVNGGKFAAFEDAGIKKHQWINSFDDKVRENPNHRISEVRTIGKEFSNGLKFPQDPDGSGSSPENIINCRCTTAAEI